MGMLLFRNVISVSEQLLHIVVNCVHYKLSKLNISHSLIVDTITNICYFGIEIGKNTKVKIEC